jgi:hypothetical protein
MKSNILDYILTGVKFVIGILGTIFFIRILLHSDALDQLVIVDQERYDVLWGLIGNAYSLTYVAVAVCVAAWVLFGLFQIGSDFKKSIPVLIGAVLFTVIFFVGWSMSNGDLVQVGDLDPISETTSHLTGAGLKMLYVLLAITVGVALFTEVKKVISR